MQVESLIVLVEEPSMEAALELILPNILREGVRFEIRQFQCKDELLKRLPERLKGYAKWLPESARILVIVDRDSDNCIALKRRLEAISAAAHLGTKSCPLNGRVHLINRIAIEELEAWFFGDWEAVRQAYGRIDPNTAAKAPYQSPDAITGGTWEAMEREMKRRGYFNSGLPKIEFARSVARHMIPSRNRSPSFCLLRDTLQAL